MTDPTSNLRISWTWDVNYGKWRLSTYDMGDGLQAGYDHWAGYYERQLIEEIERLRAGLQWLAESADPNKLTGLFVVSHARRVLSGDSSVPMCSTPDLPTSAAPVGLSPNTADLLLDDLDSIARNYEVAEYGLPNALRGELRDAVSRWMRAIGSHDETPTELQRAKELVAWLPITTEELIRLRNANKITFDKQVNSITTVLIQLRELFADSPVETSVPLTPAEMSTVARMAAVSAQVQQPEKAPAPHSLVAMYCGCLCSWCNEERAKLAEKATSDCSGCRNGYPLLAGAHERPNGAGWEVCTAQNGKGEV